MATLVNESRGGAARERLRGAPASGRLMRGMLLRSRAPIATAPLVSGELTLPEPGPGELRVRVRACATCRTDLHVIEGDLPLRRLPLVPGHQVVGTVEAPGRGATRFPPGDRVGTARLRSP